MRPAGNDLVSLALLAFGIFSMCTQDAECENLKEIVILPELVYHEITGWGQGNMDECNVPWFANLSESERERLLDRLYTLKDDGLGLNICRHYVWGGDDPSHEHMWRGPGSRKCIGIEIEPGRFVWDGREATLWHARGARSRGAALVAFWNSPPYWMTISGCSSGAKKWGDNNLRDDMVEAFARHIRMVLEGYREHYGIEFDYISPINEPEGGWWTTESGQEGCNVDAAQAIKIIKALRKELEAAGLKVPIQAPEAAHSMSLGYLDTLLGDPEARDAIHTLTCHQYSVTNSSLFRWGRRAAQAGKPLWMSEWGDWEGRGIKQAINYALKIHQAHRVMNSGVWCMWEPGFLFDEKEGTLSPRHSYYAVGHYSRFLRPGTRMIEALAPTLKVNAYLDEADSRLIVVIVNDTDKNIRAPINLARFSKVSDVRGWRTSVLEMMAQFDKKCVGGRVLVTLPAKSITTISAKYGAVRPSLVKNAGFETGDTTGWNVERGKDNAAGVEDSYVWGGHFNGFLHANKDSGARLRQEIKGLRRGISYRLGAACATSGMTARFGVRQGNRVQFEQVSGGDYKFPVIDFTALSNKAEIFYECDAQKSSGHHWATIDSVFIVEIGGGVP